MVLSKREREVAARVRYSRIRRSAVLVISARADELRERARSMLPPETTATTLLVAARRHRRRQRRGDGAGRGAFADDVGALGDEPHRARGVVERDDDRLVDPAAQQRPHASRAPICRRRRRRTTAATRRSRWRARPRTTPPAAPRFPARRRRFSPRAAAREARSRCRRAARRRRAARSPRRRRAGPRESRGRSCRCR